MNPTEPDIEILIGRLLSGNITSEQQAQVEAWISASKSNQIGYLKYVEAWDKSVYISKTQVEIDKSNLNIAYSRFLSKQWIRAKRQIKILKYAAAIAIPFGLFFIWSQIYKKDTESLVLIQQIMAPEGNRSQAILPDGTRVWLNSGANISYDAAQYNTNSREVILNGEAYFEVSTNLDIQFKVLTEFAEILVVGTSFNIKSNKESQTFEIILAEGAVKLHLKGEETDNLELRPNQQLIYYATTGIIEMNEVDAELYAAWRTGEWVFRDATLNELIEALEEIHKIQFYIYPENLRNIRFRGMISFDNNLIDVLEKIEKTSGIEYSIQNQKVSLTKRNP